MYNYSSYFAMPIVAVECDDRLSEYEAQETLKGLLKRAKEYVQFDLQNTKLPTKLFAPRLVHANQLRPQPLLTKLLKVHA